MQISKFRRYHFHWMKTWIAKLIPRAVFAVYRYCQSFRFILITDRFAFKITAVPSYAFMSSILLSHALEAPLKEARAAEDLAYIGALPYPIIQIFISDKALDSLTRNSWISKNLPSNICSKMWLLEIDKFSPGSSLYT
jgi:hypothetical protein